LDLKKTIMHLFIAKSQIQVI